MIIVVTGLHRSGSSMMMSMLQAGGIECIYDDHIPADQHNPNGYFEYKAARQGDWSFLATADGKAVKLNEMAPRMPDIPDIRVIVMRRAIENIVPSWNAIRQTKGGSELEASAYGSFIKGNLDSIRTWAADKRHIEVWYDDVISNTAVECQRIERLVGRPLDLTAMQKIPTPDLRHHTSEST